MKWNRPMSDALWSPSIPFVHLLVRTAVEFVALLLVSNAVQNSMNGGDNSVTGGLVLASVVVGASMVVGWLSFRSKRLSDFLQGRPVLLVYKGEIVPRNLEKSRAAARELHVLLRHQGLHELKDIHEAVLEANGTLSVVKTSDLPPAVAR